MKIKFFNIKVFSFLFFILFVFTYSIFILIPSIKVVNKSKRELKDMNLKIRDNIEQNRIFSFLDKKEKHIFRRENLKLKHNIPKIRTRREFTELLNQNFLYFQKLAQKDGIDCLVYIHNYERSEVNFEFFSKNKKKPQYLLDFIKIQLKNIEKKRNNGNSSLIKYEFLIKLKDLKHHRVFLCFTGNMKSSLNFINHVAWGKYYITGDKIIVSRSNVRPIFWMEIKIYFIDLTKSFYFNDLIEEKDKKKLVVDFNSDILLKNIYFNLPKRCGKKELPNINVHNVFIKSIE
jgi:hypothetical protein